MKSRTSFFNPTVFKKNLTRFAPVWILYTLALLMILTAFLDMSGEYIRSINMVDYIRFFAVVNLGYALLNVQLLFGDLYSARMCNALHALPLRRECFFCTHVISALVFSLVPTTLFSLLSMIMLGSGWSVALWFLLANTLEYLFFLGVGVFSAILTGSRFAQVLVYGLINFLSILVLWFEATLFEPLMYGVSISPDPFYIFCPVVQITQYNAGYISVERVEGLPEYTSMVAGISLNSGWWGYLAICAIIGIVLIAVAMVLYRKRNLEAAGDFIAFKIAEPVFLVLFTLGVGAFFQLVAQSFDTGLEYLFLAAGIIVGFFVGRMLLKRTTRVFQPKAFLGLGGIAAALVLSLILVKVDAFGIVRYVPDTEDVTSITFTNGYYHGDVGYVTVTEEEDIAAVLKVHEYAIEIRDDIVEIGMGYYNETYYTYLSLNYTLKNGSTLERRYSLPVDSEAGQVLKGYYTSVECVLGVPESGLDQMADSIYSLYVDSKNHRADEGSDLFRDGSIRELLEAVAADCAAGNMAQDWAIHHGDTDPSHVNIEVEMMPSEDRYDWVSFYVYDSCTHTLNWLTEHGFEIGEGMYGG